jgi:hypothetical protein
LTASSSGSVRCSARFNTRTAILFLGSRYVLGDLEAVLQRVGAARSGVIDDDGIVLAGNGFRAAAMAAGFTHAIIVDADGHTPVFVRHAAVETLYRFHVRGETGSRQAQRPAG